MKILMEAYKQTEILIQFYKLHKYNEKPKNYSTYEEFNSLVVKHLVNANIISNHVHLFIPVLFEYTDCIEGRNLQIRKEQKAREDALEEERRKNYVYTRC